MKVHDEKLNFIKSTLTGCLFVLLTIFSSNTTHAQISYSEDFETFAPDAGGTADLGGGWRHFVNLFDLTSFAYVPGGYGYTSPNGGAGGSGIGNDGDQFLNSYSNYNDTRHLSNWLEVSNFQERTLTAADVGDYTFSFDHRLADASSKPDITSPDLEELYAFIKVLDPLSGFSAVVFEKSNTANDDAWKTSTLTTTIDASMDGMILQWGFANYATNYANTGVYYDNLSFGLTPAPSAGTDIPTLGQWGLISLSLILMIFGINLIRQRKNQLRLN